LESLGSSFQTAAASVQSAFAAAFQWIGTHEAVLSGIAAAIVIVGVLYAPVRQLVRSVRRRSADGPGAGRLRAEGDAASPHPAAPGDSGAAVPPPPPRITDRPSIAVMPFANLSGDPEQEYLADGLTEDIITGLSRFRQLFVIARNSSFTYKGQAADAQRVARELGVRYVLEGSVRRGGDRIRVTAQLVDAETRRQAWAERFDRPLAEILHVDDEVTEAIVSALQPALRRAEAEHARHANPEDLTAWALVNRAWVSVQNDLGDADTAREAVRACEKALRREPDYAFGHAVLAHARSLLVRQPDPAPQEAEALAAIRRALELDADDPLVHHCHAALLGNLGRTEEAIRAWERAVELDPNNAGARAGTGIARIFLRRADEALEPIATALRLSPRDPLAYHWLGNRALALLLLGRHDEAIEAARQSLARRSSRLAHVVLAGGLAATGRAEDAAGSWAALRARFPGLDEEGLARMAGGLAPDAEHGRRLEDALRRVAVAADAADDSDADAATSAEDPSRARPAR